MAGIQLSGLVSGIDTQSIIGQLMSVERAPRTKITMQQAAINKRQSLLQDIEAKLSTLKNASDDLKSVATWVDTQTVTSSDTSKIDAVRLAGAAPGGYDVTVGNLASAEQHTYAFQSPTADTTLQVLGSDGVTVRASVPLAAGATVDDAVSAINSNADAALYAVNVQGQLVLSAKTTGTASAFSVTGAGTQSSMVAGQDASFQINGTSYTSGTNVVTNALPGVQLTLKGKTSSAVTVNVGAPGPDSDAIVGKVKAFVDAYNAVVSVTRLDLADKRVPNAANEIDAQQGTLFGDTGLSDMLTSFRNVVASPVSGLSGITSLADIGVTTGAPTNGTAINQDAVDGKLTLDTGKLTTALTTDPLGVKKLLGAVSGTDGFTGAFENALNPYTGTGGILDLRVDSATTELNDVKEQLDAFDARMDAKQAYYQQQFTAMEQALQHTQSSGSGLAGYLGSSSG